MAFLKRKRKDKEGTVAVATFSTYCSYQFDFCWLRVEEVVCVLPPDLHADPTQRCGPERRG